MTLQRYLQFYRNKLDVLDCFGVIWEPYTNKILESLSPVCKGLRYGGLGC